MKGKILSCEPRTFCCWVNKLYSTPCNPMHARLPCLSLSPWVCSNSCSLSQWCHQPSYPLLPLFPPTALNLSASESFPVKWLFASGGQSIGAWASVLLMNIEGWFPLGLTSLISLMSKGLSRVLSSTTIQKHQLVPGKTGK